MHLNETPEDVQPTTAVLAAFADRDPGEVARVFTDAGVEDDRLWLWHGPAGLEAYERRGPQFVRLFDDTDDLTTTWLEAGHTMLLVRCVDDDDATSLRRLANEHGAEETVHFGERKHSG
jgi:hypothetical protein